MVGGWHAGASPSDPLSRLVTNREPRSRHFAHTYTHPGSSSDFERGPGSGPRSSCRSSLVTGFFSSSPFTARASSIADQVCTRVKPQLELALQLLACACAACRARSPCVGRESHAFCPLVCAGSKLNIQLVHPERPDFFELCLGLGSLWYMSCISVVLMSACLRVALETHRLCVSSTYSCPFCVSYNQND